jgi:hypothetical protein
MLHQELRQYGKLKGLMMLKAFSRDLIFQSCYAISERKLTWVSLND